MMKIKKKSVRTYLLTWGFSWMEWICKCELRRLKFDRKIEQWRFGFIFWGVESEKVIKG